MKLWHRHRIVERSLDPCRPEMEYMRAVCSCGAVFTTYHGPFEHIDFQRWEKEHKR